MLGIQDSFPKLERGIATLQQAGPDDVGKEGGAVPFTGREAGVERAEFGAKPGLALSGE